MNKKLLAIPLLSTTFAWIGGHMIGQAPAMTAFGLVWGIVAMLIAPRIARRAARSAAKANTPVYVMLPLSCLVLGGSIIGHLAGPTPESFLQLVQQPGYPIFFYAVHGPFEWLLMPWALMANWSYPNRRRLLVVAATIFYLGRVASALYFAPHALEWSAHPPTDLDPVRMWINLDLIRVVLQDVVTATLMVVAALHHKFRLDSGPVLSARGDKVLA